MRPDTGSVVDRWRDEVMATGTPDALLWSADGVSIDLTNAHPGGLARLLAGGDTRLTQLFREPASQARALTHAALLRAKELELDRERGLPGCYLALGSARWGEDDTGTADAPVFLRRCRVRPVDVAGSDFDVDLVGDLIVNPALETYLTVIHRVPIDAADLVAMSRRGAGWDVKNAFVVLDALAQDIPGWRLNRTLRIATVHAAKVAAVNDFVRAESRFAAHPVIGPWLAGDRPGAEPPGGEPPGGEPPSGETLGEPRAAVEGVPTNPDEIFVLDADPAQVAVLEAVRAGTSLVIDSGPGTGKSQTIVNLAADLARVGARTLVVAPTRGARAAVVGRLEHLGLGHLVHEPQADGASWLATRRGPAPASRVPGAGGLDRHTGRESDDVSPLDDAPIDDSPLDADLHTETMAAWIDARDHLHAHVVRMHAERSPWGVSLDEIQARLVALASVDPPPRSKIRLGGPALAALDPAAREHWSRELTAIAAAGAWSADRDRDPWWGADVLDASDAARVRAALGGLSSEELTRLQTVFDEVFAGVSVPALPTLGHYRDFVVEMHGIRAVLEVFRLSVFDAPLDDLIRASQGGSRDRWRLGRALKGLLRPGATPEAGTLLLERARQVKPLWDQVRGSRVMPGQVVDLARAHTAYDVVAAHVHVLSARLVRPAGSPSLYDIPMRELSGLIRRLGDAGDRLDVLAATMPVVVAARTAGLGALVEDLAARAVPADRVAAEVDLVWWASVLQAVTAADPAYATAAGRDIRAAAARFRAADAALQHALALGLAAGTVGAEPPIWVISPYAVGLLVPDDLAFDVVVVDEAGSVGAAQAAGALARAPQAVIVGDSRLPGPRPFTAVAGGRPAGMPTPSLLDLATRTLPVFTLPWHYRSHDPRLVAAVNAVAYDGAMRTFPAPRGVDGIAIERIAVPPLGPVGPAVGGAPGEPRNEHGEAPGKPRSEHSGEAGANDTREPGTREQQEQEEREHEALAAAAAARVLDWIRAAPRESAAVVVASSAVGQRVREAVRRAATSADATALRDDLPEPLTVLDLASCAGETRDGIVLVLDRGSAGMLDARALTAALGCARARLAVLHAIPDEATTSDETQQMPLLTTLLASHRDPTDGRVSVLARDLARRLRARGLGVIEGYGVSGSRDGAPDPSDPDIGTGLGPDHAHSQVELAVFDQFTRRSPMVAVELDGAAYARAGGVRMRERLRIAQLHRLGWRAIRVASVDLFRDPAREEARIVAALEGLRSRPTVPAGGAESAAPRQGGPRRAASGPTTIGQSGVVRMAPSTPIPPSDDKPTRASRPEQTRDDTDAGWGERDSGGAHDRWLQENRPPHWE
jgi:hypothetical protein